MVLVTVAIRFVNDCITPARTPTSLYIFLLPVPLVASRSKMTLLGLEREATSGTVSNVQTNGSEYVLHICGVPRGGGPVGGL